jgi:hypothetical protein
LAGVPVGWLTVFLYPVLYLFFLLALLAAVERSRQLAALSLVLFVALGGAVFLLSGLQ